MLKLLFLISSMITTAAATYTCTQPTASLGYNAPTADPTFFADSADTGWPVTDGTSSFASACATGYSGTVVAAACASDGAYTLSGCTANAVCTRPGASAGYDAPTADPTFFADSADTGWPVTDGSDSFASACATGYSGTVIAAACASDGAYTLSGCTANAVFVDSTLTLTCDAGFFLDTTATDGATCTACRANAASCTSDVVDSTCDAKFFLDTAATDGDTCTACRTGAATCTSLVVDSACVDGFLLDSDATCVVVESVVESVEPVVDPVATSDSTSEDDNIGFLAIIIGCGVVAFGILLFIFYPRKREKNVKKSDEVFKPLLNGELNFEIDF